MARHNGLKAGLIIINLIAFLVLVSFVVMSAVGNDLYLFVRGTFNLNYDGGMLPMHTTAVPPPWTFVLLWGLSYIWMFFWVLYTLYLLCTRSYRDTYVYVAPNFLPGWFYGSMILFSFLNIAWLFLDDRVMLWQGLIVMSLMSVMGFIGLGAAVVGLRTTRKELERMGNSSHVGLSIVLVQNGVAMIASWASFTTVYIISQTMVNVVGGVDHRTAAYTALGILATELLVWFILDAFAFWRYTLYIFTPYVVFIIYMIGLILTSDYSIYGISIFEYVLLGFAVLFLVIKMIVACMRSQSYGKLWRTRDDHHHRVRDDHHHRDHTIRRHEREEDRCSYGINTVATSPYDRMGRDYDCGPPEHDCMPGHGHGHDHGHSHHHHPPPSLMYDRDDDCDSCIKHNDYGCRPEMDMIPVTSPAPIPIMREEIVMQPMVRPLPPPPPPVMMVMPPPQMVMCPPPPPPPQPPPPQPPPPPPPQPIVLPPPPPIIIQPPPPVIIQAPPPPPPPPPPVVIIQQPPPQPPPPPPPAPVILQPIHVMQKPKMTYKPVLVQKKVNPVVTTRRVLVQNGCPPSMNAGQMVIQGSGQQSIPNGNMVIRQATQPSMTSGQVVIKKVSQPSQSSGQVVVQNGNQQRQQAMFAQSLVNTNNLYKLN